MNDYARIRELSNISLPDQDASRQAIKEYYIRLGSEAILGDAPWISGVKSGIGFNTPINRGYLGFDVRHVNQSIIVGTWRNPLEVVRGRYDPKVTDAALDSCAECVPPEKEEYGGLTIYKWGEDLEANLAIRLTAPAFDVMGRGGRIAVSNGYAFRTLETHTIKELIDTRQGRHQSLADAEEFSLMTEALTEIGVYTAFASDRTQAISEFPLNLHIAPGIERDPFDKIGQRLEGSPLLHPYQMFVIGSGKDSGGTYTALVLVHESEDLAKQNAGIMERRILDAERISGKAEAEPVETSSEGRVVVAKMRGPSRYNAWQGWYLRDVPLLLHE